MLKGLFVEFNQSNAGTVRRSVQDKLREKVSVLDFIPVSEHERIKAGTSTFNCRSSIQSALDSGAKAVYFPAGTYSVWDATDTFLGTVLTLVSNQTLYGDGAGSILKLGAHTTTAHRMLAATSLSNITIRDLKLDGNQSEQTGASDEQSHNMLFMDCTGVKVINVISVSAKGDGAYIGGDGATGCSDVLIMGSTMDSNYRQALSIVKGEYIRVVGNDLANTTGTNPGAGIDIESNTVGANLRLITITGNTIRGNNWGIFINELSPARQVTITGNTFSDNRAADVVIRGENVTVADNMFYLSGKDTQTGPGVDIYLAKQVAVVGNTFIGNHDPEDRGGVRVSRGCRQISILGNTIKKTTGSGIMVYTGTALGTGETRGVTVVGNCLEDCLPDSTASGSMVIGAAAAGAADLYDVVAQNNTIHDTRSGGLEADHGIRLINQTDAMMATWFIKDNTIRGTTGQITSITGWENIASLLTVKATLNFDLTASASQDLTIAATGAVVGAPVSLGVPAASVTADTLFWAWVSAADTITVRAMRIAGTPDPASGTFTVTYVKLLTH